ncbi:MAG: hypothetical protein FWF10_03785 [Clostridiales bacterium]|nr:hypothetical protein [Clostridiales bacterium]
MKRTRNILALCLAVIIIVMGLAACVQKDAPPAPIVGGYTEDRAVTEDDLAVFNAAMEHLVGVNYVPTLVATQVVAGTNYRFMATAMPVVPDAESYEVYIYIFQPLAGDPELVEIVNI